MLHRYLIAELLKLRRSLVLLLSIAAPSCVVILNTLIALRNSRPPLLPNYGMSVSGIWAFVMLPLAITALSVLMAQMEHGPRSWHHLLTLPGARPNIYLAKAIMVLALIVGMSTLLWTETIVSGTLIASVRADAVGAVDPLRLAILLGRMFVATTLVAMIQLWVALRYKSFVPPLVVGIGGTFVAISATSAKEGLYVPWLMAVNTLSSPERQSVALMLGGLGGVAALLAMLFHLSWREA